MLTLTHNGINPVINAANNIMLAERSGVGADFYSYAGMQGNKVKKLNERYRQ